YPLTVTPQELSDSLRTLDGTLRNIETVLDLDRLRKEKAELEAAASAPDLWDDQAKAQKVTSRLSYAQAEINRLEGLRRRLDDAGVLLELSEAEEDPSVLAEVAGEVAALGKAIEELEVRTL